MSARDQILGKIKSMALPETALPLVPAFSHEFDLYSEFRQSLEANGAIVIESTDEEVGSYLHNHFSEPVRCVSLNNDFTGNVTLESVSTPSEMSEIEAAVIHADFGVAENGALWINPEELKIPVLPFIIAHLVILVKRDSLVATMHQAYAKVKLRDQGFGLFIAGPSKTADIEQSLVIGAHGPLSLRVILT